MAEATVIASDIGGTFTDIAVKDGDRLRFGKVPTAPENLAGAMLAGVEGLGVRLDAASLFFHGTTVVINAVLERSGARTALVTTAGFRDVYELGRGSRPEPYDMLFRKEKALVPRHLRLEVEERMSASGEPLAPVDRDSVARVGRALADAEVAAVAVCLVNSYRNPAHEIEVATLLGELLPGVPITASYALAREYGEYERTSTTVLNAYVMPRAGAYLGDMASLLAEKRHGGHTLIMQSSGGCMSLDEATRVPLAVLESGPAAGGIAAAEVTRELDIPRAVAFDMGGTTAKATLIEDHRLRTVRPYSIGGQREGLPSLLPVVDLVEVGTGGGSIATLDQSGLLEVGPRSAGANPGPACYGRGGTQPTVTDANLILGRLNAGAVLGGELRLERERAEAAFAPLAAQLGLGLHETALGVVRIADNAMSLAVRQVTVERGRDPRELTMIAFGGAGPCHAVAIARNLGIRRVVVPWMPGAFSAYGMLMSDARRELIETFIVPLDAYDRDAVAARVSALAERAADGLRFTAEDWPRDVSALIELRYVGQGHPLAVPLSADVSESVYELRERYSREHEAVYGFRVSGEPIETVALRVTATVRLPKPGAAVAPTGHGPAATTRAVWHGPQGPDEAVVHARESLAPGTAIDGPAIVEEETATTVLAPGDRATVDAAGNLVIAVGGADG